MIGLFENRNRLISLLIKQRCRCASKQDEYIQLSRYIDIDEKKIIEYKQNANDFIYSLFPPRCQWVHLGKNSNRVNLDTEERNRKRLLYTIRKTIQTKEEPDWMKHLNDYVDKLLKMLQHPETGKLDIHVTPICKSYSEDKKTHIKLIECRPICIFARDERIILSYLNNFLTNLFDNDFYPCSYAFRKPTKERQGYMHILAVKQLQKYRREHLHQVLYVAECDMKKFYDTIAHSVIRKRFNQLLDKHIELQTNEKECIMQWLNIYLSSYNFYEDVYKVFKEKPASEKDWSVAKNACPKRYRDANCKVEWVNDLIEDECTYNGEPRGIPQGGALSTLLANVVLHFVDEPVLQSTQDKGMLYMRFCDDMILVGVNKIDVSNAFETYMRAIEDSKLFPHKQETKYSKDFWDGKTREPYMWGKIAGNVDVHPWVTFVGFDCNWEGDLRIRKKTLHKEISKQYSTVNNVLCSSNKGLRCSRKSTLGYIKQRLMAMSVGIINMHNYLHNRHVHSWMKAFVILEENKWTRWQLKHLDRCRMIAIYKASRILKDKDEGMEHHNDGLHYDERKYHGKMFSYYGQCFTYR